MTLANSAKEVAKASSPISRIGLRPQWSLRLPQKVADTTQIAADTANTVVVCTSLRCSCRDSGGRMLNSTVCPAPMQSRLTNRTANARRRSAGVVTWVMCAEEGGDDIAGLTSANGKRGQGAKTPGGVAQLILSRARERTQKLALSGAKRS